MDSELTVVESLCPNCFENGVTRLLPHKIPYFRCKLSLCGVTYFCCAGILITSFSCPHCGHQNNEVQPISEIQPMGERIELAVMHVADLDRQVVKSEHASIIVPELEFEIPSTTQRGISSTVQGMMSQATEALRSTQPKRYEVDPEVARQVGEFIVKLENLTDIPLDTDPKTPLATPFTFVIDDPSGNSFIENLIAPKKDPQLKSSKYVRTMEQLHAMGYYEEQSSDAAKHGADLPDEKQSHEVWDLSKAVEDGDEREKASATFVFPCPHCGKDGAQNMCEIDIPGFRKCWVMAFVCDFCGAKSNEVKPAGKFGDKGRIWNLRVEETADLNRDILKSDTAAIKVPALELELDYGTLGGVFTTIEGLLRKIADEIDEKLPFHGDSQVPERKARINSIVSGLRAMADGTEFPFDIILDDMADLSHIGRREDAILFLTEGDKSENAVKSKDEQLSSEEYERSFEQNDVLGLNDMKVD